MSLACAYAAWWHIENWGSEYSLVGTILFALAALGAASVIPYCFSRRRRFIEALDALESDVPDQYPRR